MSKSYRRGGDDRFEAKRRRNERRNNSPKREWQSRAERNSSWPPGSIDHMPENSSGRY